MNEFIYNNDCIITKVINEENYSEVKLSVSEGELVFSAGKITFERDD